MRGRPARWHMGVFTMFPKLQQNSCKYYRSIDLVRKKIL